MPEQIAKTEEIEEGYFLCPKCKDEISFLVYECSKTSYWGGSVSVENGKVDYSAEEYCSDDYDDSHDVAFKCPECDEILFTTEAEAEKFLLSEKKEEAKPCLNSK